jgi:mRNA N6-methyladenine demethylase
MQNVAADPMPELFKTMIKRLLKWHVLPMTCIPDSCIVNIYESGDCIPPHIDSHNFLRPFCTVSFLSECNFLFGANIKVLGPGEFTGSFSILLPVGYVLLFPFTVIYFMLRKTPQAEVLAVVLEFVIVG